MMQTTWLLLCLVIPCLRADTYFKSVTGTVPAGNFTYYSLITEGAIQIILKTKKGDADLYISQTSVTPTYDPEGYCLHSATCGVDVVDIPSSFGRPVGIGIYGHPSHEESDYVLELKVKSESDEDGNHFDDSESRESRQSPDLGAQGYEEEEDPLVEIGKIEIIMEPKPNTDDNELRMKLTDKERKSWDFVVLKSRTNGRSCRSTIHTHVSVGFYRHLPGSYPLVTVMMLEFENQMFLDVLNNNCLVISAKGLSIETIVLNLIKVHSDPGNLVFVLGATPDEEQFFISELETQKVSPLPKVINAEVGEREEVYLGGGVFFISSRILVVDFLKNRVPIDKVTGVIVLKAHRILDKAQEAFSLRLFRQKNRTGFINAFSRSPQTFSSGIMKLERIMKTLFVTELHLWPRFHAVVNASLKERQPEVIELNIELSNYMSSIQTAVLDCVHFCTKEIKRINPSLDTEDVTVENALSKQYYKLLQSRLDPIWNQLSSRTKQLIADLKTLRSILEYLTQSDCVRLHHFLSTLRSKEYTSKSGGWMILDSAETIFVVSKKRLFDDNKELTLEPNPKWQTLTEVLREVQLEDRKKDTQPSVVVLVQNQSTVYQLKQILTLGVDATLKHWYYKKFGNESLKKEKEDPKEEEPEENADSVLLTQRLDSTNDGNSTILETTLDEPKSEKDLLISIQPFKKDDDGLYLMKSLIKLKPDAVVMYDVDVTTIRQIEVYQRAHAENIIKVFFLIYGGSVEEQVYLSSLRQEKMAFEKLIMEKKVLVMEDVTEVFNEVSTVIKNTREGGGGTSEAVIPKIIVDMREFRSELPSLLHKRGIQIEPVTIQVGDYILSPEMCVERKSISDLIGSLNSGRLYTQALAMTRHYAKPILLIEFDENKPFALQGRYYLSSDISNNDIQSKLQLLTLHFPRLRLVWSHSPFASAQLLHELKEGKEEPSASTAAAIGLEDAPLEDEQLDKYNIMIQDFVSKLPGINSKNIRTVLNKGKSLSHLLTLTLEDLYEMLGNKNNAELLFSALHKAPAQAQESTSSFRAKPTNRPFRKRPRT